MVCRLCPTVDRSKGEGYLEDFTYLDAFKLMISIGARILIPRKPKRFHSPIDSDNYLVYRFHTKAEFYRFNPALIPFAGL
jgi:hypothetical protein